MVNTSKTAIVTGALRGIGAGLVEAFLERGYNVVANSRNITKANPFAAAANIALIDGDIGNPAPLGSEVRADGEGFLTLTPKGIAEDFAQDLPENEKQLLTATQGPTAAAVFRATVTTAAWQIKPSSSAIASN